MCNISASTFNVCCITQKAVSDLFAFELQVMVKTNINDIHRG